jgi:transcriptional regulator with XRE-family HTH domain
MGLRSNPTYRQRRFGAEVRKLRELAQLSVAEAAGLMGMKPPHLSNVESGRTSLTTERLHVLVQASGIRNNPYVDALLEMGQDSGKGWWSQYRNELPQPYLDFAELEASAVTLINYEPMFVPGLLQTRSYAEAVHRGGYTRRSQEYHAAAIDFRIRRQAVLLGERPPRLHFIFHEAALHAAFGDRELMRDQMLRLIEVSRLPHVTVQVLPFEGQVPFGTAFVLVEPSVPELSTAVITQVDGSHYLADADSLSWYKRLFATLAEGALPRIDTEVMSDARTARDSLGLIQRLLYPLL